MAQRFTPVLEISRKVDAIPSLKVLLSSEYCFIASKTELTSALLFALLAWENCLAGLMASKTMKSKIASVAITTKNSVKEKLLLILLI